jgi:hypothetical protein
LVRFLYIFNAKMLSNYHLLFEKPKAKFLWKFVDMNKFLSMLQNSDLHFSPLDQLNDIFEGANTINSTFIQFDYVNGFLPEFQRNKTMPSEFFNENQQSFKNRIEALRTFQKNFLVDCYFEGDEESVAMWSSYSLLNGIAIRFDSELLFQEILNYSNEKLQNDYEFGFGPISYEKLTNPNYEKLLQHKIEDIVFEPFKKDVFHSHENEYRFIFYKKGKEAISHLKIEIDLKKSITEIVAHPNSQDWVIETIYKLVIKYGLIKEVKKSRIITSEMASRILR